MFPEIPTSSEPELTDGQGLPDTAPLAPSLNLTADQVAKFGLSDLPQGSTVTARVTFKVGGAGGGMGDTSLEAINFSEVTPSADGTSQEEEPEMEEDDVEQADNEEKALGYRRVTDKKKAPKLDMKGLQSRF